MSEAVKAERKRRLTERLLSAQVQVPEIAEPKKVRAELDETEVVCVFLRHVPGVEEFLFRDKPGCFALQFMVGAYRKGLQAFKHTPVHKHLVSMLRSIVHHANEDGEGASQNLQEVAEAFKDCQAIQARTIERVGMRLLGVAADFHGVVVSLLGEYKALAIKMLAHERLRQGLAMDFDPAPTHYENRLTADLGERLGLDAASVRLATLDQHASQRFRTIKGAQADAAAKRCRELFDLTAFFQALVAEVNSFTSESPPESLAGLFLKWVPDNLCNKHTILDEETCSRPEVNDVFVHGMLEALFMGGVAAPSSETFRGLPLVDIFPHRLTTPDIEEAATQPMPTKLRRKRSREFMQSPEEPQAPKVGAEAMDGPTASSPVSATRRQRSSSNLNLASASLDEDASTSLRSSSRAAPERGSASSPSTLTKKRRSSSRLSLAVAPVAPELDASTTLFSSNQAAPERSSASSQLSLMKKRRSGSNLIIEATPVPLQQGSSMFVVSSSHPSSPSFTNKRRSRSNLDLEVAQVPAEPIVSTSFSLPREHSPPPSRQPSLQKNQRKSSSSNLDRGDEGRSGKLTKTFCRRRAKLESRADLSGRRLLRKKLLKRQNKCSQPAESGAAPLKGRRVLKKSSKKCHGKERPALPRVGIRKRPRTEGVVRV